MMYHQYLIQAKGAIGYLSSDGLKDLLNDDDKLEEYVDDVVSKENNLRKTKSSYSYNYYTRSLRFWKRRNKCS